jgi:predicted ATP-grasp superfamily ATP-dependent carboligase
MKLDTVLILDGEQRAALAATRSLGKKGIPVIAGSEYPTSLAGSSRYACKQISYPSPLMSPEAFIRNLNWVIESNGIGFLLPITDATMHQVLKHSSKLNPKVKLPLVTFDKYLMASNKLELMKLAARLDVPIPETIFVDSIDQLDMHLLSLEYPVIIKPQSSLIKHGDTIIRTGVKFASDPDQLIRSVQNNEAFHYPFMVQEKIYGKGLGLFALCNNGESLALFSHRRIREKPPSGGVSVVSESTIPNPLVKDYALRLLKELKWDGVAMVEFKWDDRRNLPVLMEINARFWGSLQLAIDCGIDYPYLLYLQSMGLPIPSINESHYSRLRWLLGDIDNLYIVLKTRRDLLPYEYRDKVQVLINFFREFILGSRSEVLRWDDFRPFLWEFNEYIKVNIVPFFRNCFSRDNKY